MSPYHRNVLLETNYALDHLLWSYRSELDRNPTRNLTADDICLSDFAARTSSLVRGVLDADAQRGGPKLAFRPPSVQSERRMADALQNRRETRAVKETLAATTQGATPDAVPSPASESDEPALLYDVDGEPLAPDAISPSTLPNRRRPR